MMNRFKTCSGRKTGHLACKAEPPCPPVSGVNTAATNTPPVAGTFLPAAPIWDVIRSAPARCSFGQWLTNVNHWPEVLGQRWTGVIPGLALSIAAVVSGIRSPPGTEIGATVFRKSLLLRILTQPKFGCQWTILQIGRFPL